MKTFLVSGVIVKEYQLFLDFAKQQIDNNISSAHNVLFMEAGKDCMVVTFLEPVIRSVTTPGTEQSTAPVTGKAASEKSAHFHVAKEEKEKPSPQPPSSAQRSDSPIIQEPEDPQLHQDDLSPKRTSLVIVESTDEQTEKFGRGYEEESIEKVDTNFASKFYVSFFKKGIFLMSPISPHLQQSLSHLSVVTRLAIVICTGVLKA